MTANWRLMASHGTVLFYLVTRPDATIREIAGATELTERRVSQIIRDLSRSDVLQVHRHGRRNMYTVNDDATFATPVQDIRMGSVVSLIREAEALRDTA
jgi:DNA-binding MarR family transcriptional regulator